MLEQDIDGIAHSVYVAVVPILYGRYGNHWSLTATGTDGGWATQPSLTVNGSQVASTTYGQGSTPGSIVSALAASNSGGSPVSLTANGTDLPPVFIPGIMRLSPCFVHPGSGECR